MFRFPPSVSNPCLAPWHRLRVSLLCYSYNTDLIPPEWKSLKFFNHFNCRYFCCTDHVFFPLFPSVHKECAVLLSAFFLVYLFSFLWILLRIQCFYMCTESSSALPKYSQMQQQSDKPSLAWLLKLMSCSLSHHPSTPIVCHTAFIVAQVIIVTDWESCWWIMISELVSEY